LGVTNRVEFEVGTYLHSDQLPRDDYYAKVTFVLGATSDFHDKVWLYFNIDPAFTATGSGMSGSLTATSHYRYCAVQLTPRDSGSPNISTTQAGNGSTGQLSDASIGGPGVFTFSGDLATGSPHTFMVKGRGDRFRIYVDDVFMFDTRNLSYLPHWDTAQEIFDTPGVGFGFQQKNTDTLVVTTFEAGTSASDPTPADGCQDFTGSVTIP
jgi:hypothetical protein